MFVTLVNVAANNMGSYLSIIKVMKARKLNSDERNLEIVQMEIFEARKGGISRKVENTS